MKKLISFPLLAGVFLSFLSLFLDSSQNREKQTGKGFPADALVSQMKRWTLAEEPLTFFPETLFEYINGAAEIYLSYDFKVLTVVQFAKEGNPVNLSVEIYEMSSPISAFGIYSAERFSDSTFIPVGVQGYIEEGALNFLAGSYYIKLICFEGGGECEVFLKMAAGLIENISGAEKDFPEPLSHFPREGLIANSEKYILKNVMGYSFLHDGYFANYEMDGIEFDCFLIVGKDEEDARKMLENYLEAKKELTIQTLPSGILIKDRYYKSIFLARSGYRICGVMKIPEDKSGLGEKYLKTLLASLSD